MITYVKYSLAIAVVSLFVGISQAQGTKPAQTPATQTDAWLNLASAYIDQSQTDSAQYALNQGFRVVEKTPYAVGEYFLLSYQTELLDKSLLFDEAFRYALKALRKAEAIGDQELIGDSYMLLGLLYNDSGQPNQAIRYLRKSLDLLPAHSRQIHPVSQRYHALLNLGECYQKLYQHGLATRYLDQALHEAAAQRDYRIMAIASRFSGNAYYSQGQYALAKQQYLAGRQYALSILDWDAVIIFYPHLFQVYYREKQYQKALDLLHLGIRLVEQSPGRIATLPRKNFYLQLVPIYRLLGDYPKALQTQQTVLDITELINRQNSSRQLLLLQEFHKQENYLLQLTNERAAQKIVLRQNQRQNLALIGLLALLAVVFGVIYYSLRQSRKLERLKQQQQLVVLEQQREVAALKAMIAGEEQERNRLAHELHNGIGGLLMSARYSLERQLGAAPGMDGSEPLKLIDDAYQEVRRMSHNLMPPTLQYAGLVAAVEQYCSTVSRSTQLQITFQTYGLTERVAASLELWLYRVVQELVTNVLKHAGATTVLVQLSYVNECIHLTVDDNGRGFRVDEMMQGYSMGLRQLIDRTTFMHGTAHIESEPGEGTFVHINLPVPSQPHTTYDTHRIAG